MPQSNRSIQLCDYDTTYLKYNSYVCIQKQINIEKNIDTLNTLLDTMQVKWNRIEKLLENMSKK